jgi:hypothetical protein
MADNMDLIWLMREAKYFWAGGLDRWNRVEPLHEIRLLAQPVISRESRYPARRELDSTADTSGIPDHPLEPVTGLAEGETRWRVMTTRTN